MNYRLAQTPVPDMRNYFSKFLRRVIQVIRKQYRLFMEFLVALMDWGWDLNAGEMA